MKKRRVLALILICLVILLSINGIYCNNTLEISNYKISNEKLNTKLKIIFIADLHNKEFGDENCELVQKISEQEPDIIAVGGDMVTRYFADDSVMKTLLKQLSKIAPTYCVLGNHELSLINEIDFPCDIAATGAVLLNDKYVTVEKDGESFLIGGLSNYPENNNSSDIFWNEFKNLCEDKFTLLLCHRPEYAEDLAEQSDVSLILSGHAHGGLVRLPFAGGVFAPGQGLFPKYDKGEYDLDGSETKLVVTSGLSNSNPLPRINNCADICVIEFSVPPPVGGFSG